VSMQACPWLSWCLARPRLLFTSRHGRGPSARLGPCSACTNRQSIQSSGVRGLRVQVRFGLVRHAFHQRFNSRFRRCQIPQPISHTSSTLSAVKTSFCTHHLSVVVFVRLTLPALRGFGSFFLPPAPILNFPAYSYVIPAPMVPIVFGCPPHRWMKWSCRLSSRPCVRPTLMPWKRFWLNSMPNAERMLVIRSAVLCNQLDALWAAAWKLAPDLECTRCLKTFDGGSKIC
jgi:hypothetical protein